MRFKRFAGILNSHFHALAPQGAQANSGFQAFRWQPKITSSLRRSNEFYVSSVSLAPQIRIFAAELKRILRAKRPRCGAQADSHARCGAQANSTFQAFYAFHWHPSLASSLRSSSEFYVSSVSLAPKFRILAAELKRILRAKRPAGTQIRIRAEELKRILCFKRFASTQISHHRCGAKANSTCQAFRWHS